jgi:peptidoglycan-associated lipoprotein
MPGSVFRSTNLLTFHQILSLEELNMKRLILIAWPALLMAACSTPKPPAPPAPPPQAAAPVPPPVAPAPPPAKPAPVATESPMEAFERARASLSASSIYFDFDKSAIKSEADSLIAQHARLLQSYPNDKLTLQGNCDERGSREYNLALGQRRADGVKEKLLLMGVPASRIDTVSFGKEKPRELCHEERCWSENRRADFVDTWKQLDASR